MPVIIIRDTEGELRTCNSLWKAARIARQKKRGRGHVARAHPTKKVTKGRLWATTPDPKQVKRHARLEAIIAEMYSRV